MSRKKRVLSQTELMGTGQGVAKWLNLNNESLAEGRKQVAELIALFQTVTGNEDDRLGILRGRLLEYRFTPLLRDPARFGRWHVDYIPLPLNPGGIGASQLTAACVRVLIQLAEAGTVHRLRRCERQQCGRWYFAYKDTQRFCPGSNCRSLAARATPEGKAKWKRYMRKKMRERYHNFESKKAARRFARRIH